MLITQNDITPRLVGHAGLFELHDIVERSTGQCLVDALVLVIVDATLLSPQPLRDKAVLGGTVAGDTLLDSILGYGRWRYASGQHPWQP